jgi:hypothetical protein
MPSRCRLLPALRLERVKQTDWEVNIRVFRIDPPRFHQWMYGSAKSSGALYCNSWRGVLDAKTLFGTLAGSIRSSGDYRYRHCLCLRPNVLIQSIAHIDTTESFF